MKISWTRNTAKYATGDICRLGRVHVGNVHQPSVSRGQTPPWRATVLLPGIKLDNSTIDHATKEEAMARVERAVAAWVAWSNEEPR